ncbi:hypothetical protein tb265_27740 [Gemmatimonadetes bacterium T265]|nr:hypothetical protein tb265_27740 [Gemmatimonadetes bacterium T265]
MPALYLYDDRVARTFAPFALTRPAAALRAGALLVAERWARALGVPVAGYVTSPDLQGFEEPGASPVAPEVLPAGAVVANARFAPSLARAAADDVAVWRGGGRVAAVRLDAPVAAAALVAAEHPPAAAGAEATLDGWWNDAAWDYVGQLQTQLAADLPVLAAELDTVEHPGVVLGGGGVYVERGATVEPYVVFDVNAGPVVVRRGATVQAFTRVVGPCYVGEHSLVTADRISGCAIGDHCKVHGEISASVLVGHANKAHDGFVGHSYLGRWVNLGAGTTTSNLKNTYGTVALWTPQGVRDSGLQFLGTLFGDHAKTGIGLTLTTGTVVGAGANVYERMPPKYVPPFSWGGGAPYDTYDVERFLRVAERAMARRQLPLTPAMRGLLARAHARRGDG